jgi:hypothetical protein
MLGDTAGISITLNNIQDGDTIEVKTTQDGTTFNKAIVFTTTGLTLKWVGTAQPTKSAGASAIDIWRFKRYGTMVLADAILNFA